MNNNIINDVVVYKNNDNDRVYYGIYSSLYRGHIHCYVTILFGSSSRSITHQKNTTNFRHRSPCLICRLRQGFSRGATGHKEHRLRAAASDCNMDKMVIPRLNGNTAFNGAEQEERRAKKETEQQVVSSSKSAFCQWIKAVASQSEAPHVCCFPSDGEEENTLQPRAKPKTSSVPTPSPPPPPRKKDTLSKLTRYD